MAPTTRTISALKTTDTSLPQVKFDGKNYVPWKRCIRLWARAQKICAVLDGTEHLDQVEMDSICAKICLTIEDRIVGLVEDCRRPKDILTTLDRRYERNDGFAFTRLLNQLRDLRYKEGNDIQEFVSIFEDKVRQIEQLRSIDEEILMSIFMDALPATFDIMKRSFKCNQIISLERLIQMTLDEAVSINSSSSKTKMTNQAFLSQIRCYGCGRIGHKRNTCKVIKCFKCNKTGHISSSCPTVRSKLNHNKTVLAASAHDKENGDDFERAFVADEKKLKNWIIDSGATSHFATNKEILHNVSHDYTNVKTANGEIATSTMTGDVQIETGQTVVKMKEVKVVPGFDQNLFSVSKACDNGQTVMFTDEQCLIFEDDEQRILNDILKKAKIKLVAPRVGNTYMFEPNLDEANMTNSELLHKRLGHPGIAKLRRLISVEPDFNCDDCKRSKSTRSSHPLVRSPINLMQRISADTLQLPMSVDGFSYVLNISENHSRFGGVYCMKSKSETVDNVIHFIEYCEKKTGTLIKEFYSDNGKEFVNDKLMEYLKRRAIIFLTSAPYTPQQNGLIERRNRTILDTVRTLILNSKMPVNFWSYAVETANYLINRWPTKDDKTPFERLFGCKPDIRHLRTFGCLAFWRVPDTWRNNKLVPVAKKMIFIGYTTTTRNYKLLDPNTGETFISSDVKFDELRNGYHEITEKEPEETWDSVLEHVYFTYDEPTSYEEAINCKDSVEWKEAMKSELNDLQRRQVYSVTDKVEKKPIDSKWIFKRKSDGRFRARLVVKGFQQNRSGGDFTRIDAPTVSQHTIRTILSIALMKKMLIKMIDVKCAFLYSDLKELIFVNPPEGCGDGTWKLNKALYGLKQGPNEWYSTIKNYFTRLNLKCSVVDNCLFFDKNYFVLIYVDDMLICATNENLLKRIITDISLNFEISTSEGSFLGMEFIHKIDTVYISQNEQTMKLLQSYKTESLKPRKYPIIELMNYFDFKIDETFPVRELIGSLLHLAVSTRPDIKFAVSYLSRFMTHPSQELWNSLLDILRYLNGTLQCGIKLTTPKEITVKVYTDASFRNKQTEHSTSGIVVFIDENLVAWQSKKQPRLASSTDEAELTAALDGWKIAEPIRQLLDEIGIPAKMILFCDNSASVCHLNTGNFKGSKHFEYDKKLFASRISESSNITVEKVLSKDQLADPLTKPQKTLLNFYKLISVVNVELGEYVGVQH